MSVGCERGHDTHATRRVDIELGVPHPYHDLPPIPAPLARAFTMNVWDEEQYPAVDDSYCPGRDALSWAVRTHGVWEVQESILALTVCESDAPGVVVDFGAHVGWFTLLAASCGRTVVAIEADPENCRLLRANVELNNWQACVGIRHEQIDELSPSFTALVDGGRIRFVKIDVEGAEYHAVGMLQPSIDAGLVDHLLVEISPCFADYYPDLVADLIDAGFEAYRMPLKQVPPLPVTPPEKALRPYRLHTLSRDDLRRTVGSWSQANVWFKRKDAAW